MAHEIDQSTGKAAIFVTGEPAWHRLGTVVEQAQTSAEAIKLAHLDWQVVKKPCFADIDGQHVETNSFATVRSDTKKILGVVGSSYLPFQNHEAFDFMDSLVGEKLAMFGTAGALRGGRRVWMMARIPQEYRIAKDDVVKPYVLLTNSHDGTQAVRMIPTTVRVVCQNTLNLALRAATSSEGLTITHNQLLESRIAEARAKFGIIAKRLSEFELQAQAMAKKTMTSEQLATFFTKLVEGRSEKSQKTQLEAWFENLHNERNYLPEIKGTVWAALNAVTEYADHGMGAAGSDETEKLDGRLSSMWFGTSNALARSKALDTTGSGCWLTGRPGLSVPGWIPNYLFLLNQKPCSDLE